MVIITKGALHDFIGINPSATVALNDWYMKTKAASWSQFSEVKQTFNSVDAIGNDRFVFNIAGNHFRLVAMIHFPIRTLYIRGIFTHTEYSILSKENRLLKL